MKDNKLYTVNKHNVKKWNRPAFMPEENLFDWGGLAAADKKANPWNYADDLDTTQQYMQSKNAFGISKADNPFSKGNLQGGLKSMASTPIGGALISGAAGAIGGLANSAISGGLESEAGSAISSIGSTIGGAVGSVNPVLGAAIGVGSQVLGGLTNAAFGIKEDTVKKQAVEAGINQNINFKSNAGSFDEVKGPQAVMTNTDVYSGGWFSGGKARRKNEELKRRMIEARSFANRSVDNNIFNLQDDQLNNQLANYSAFGGPIDIFGNNDMSAINYDLMSDYINTKRKQADTKNKMTNLFMGTPNSMFAFGGDMQTNFADFGTGLTHIDAGSSHELNPNDGVQLGVDAEGTPNLVEENETVYNDYVYSARINMDQAAKEKFHFPKKKDITYAEATKKLEKEIAERPNDPLSQAGFKAQMQTLADEQERQKAEMEAARAREAFEALSPEEQTAVMQQAAQQEAMAQHAAIEQQQAMQQPSPEDVAMMQQQMTQADGSEAMIGQEPQMNACGGKLYPWGGYTNLFAIKPPYQASRTAGFIPYDRNLSEDEVLKLEQEENFKNWTDYVNQNWDSEEVQNYLKMLDAAAGGNHLFDKEGKLLDTAKDYFNNARTKNHKWGYYHLTPELLAEAAQEEAAKEVIADIPEAKIYHALEGDDDYIQGELDPEVVGDETRRVKLDNGDTVIYHDRKAKKNTPIDENDTKKVAPNLKADWPRYMGLFGPAVGLGLQLAGVGRPDTASLDAAISGAGNAHLADYQPLGDYLTYRPMDIWFEQNRLNADARATDRAILNTGTNQGNKAAALLASGYNSQLASGDLYRKALEYNDAQRERVASFNRGTNQFNADAYNQTSRFNASALNQANQAAVNAKLHAASQKLDADAGWYNGIYGNVAGLFKGLSDLGKENAQHNMIAKMWANGLAGTATPDTPVADDYLTWDKKSKKKAKGGKNNKKHDIIL